MVNAGLIGGEGGGGGGGGGRERAVLSLPSFLPF